MEEIAEKSSNFSSSSSTIKAKTSTAGRQLELQDLPQEILERIFALLTFRERIRAERVSRAWRALCQHRAWTRQRWIVCTREMLQIPEPWKNAEAIEQEMRKLEPFQTETCQQIGAYYKLHQECDGKHGEEKVFCPGCPKRTNAGKNADKYSENMRAKQQHTMDEYRRALSDPRLYKQRRPSRQLLVLRALLRRCGPHLLGLHLGPDIGVAMRYGRLYPAMTALAHLRVDEPLDEWHLRQIETHLADRLLSLSIGTLWSRRKLIKKRIQTALASLLARCQRLECLCVDNLCDLFFPLGSENEEEEKKDEGGGNDSEQQMKKRLEPIVPGTLRYLHTRLECDHRVYNAECANQLRALLDKCPQLRYFLPVLWDSRWGDVDLEEELVKRLMSLQWPYVYSRNSWYLQLHPRLATLRALRLEPEDGVKASDLAMIADHCVQLEHLDVRLVYRVYGYYREAVVPLREELEQPLLNRLPRLCSLGFTLEVFSRDYGNSSMLFHEMSGDDGQQLDKTFLDILTQRNSIKPLRSLEIHHGYRYNSAQLNSENILYVLQNFTHLETLSCPVVDWPRMEMSEFAGIIKATLDAMTFDNAAASSESPPSIREKTLIFKYSDNLHAYKWRIGAERMELASGVQQPPSWPFGTYRPECSPVLCEILEQTFGQDTSIIHSR